MNSVILIGRMVADPELKYTPSGVAVCSFRIAVDRKFKSQSGEREADFIDIVAWRQSAEFIANYVNKGRLVAVQGSMQTRSWVAQDGSKRRTVEVVADSVQALDKAKEAVQNNSSSTNSPAMTPPDPFSSTSGIPDWSDSDSNYSPYNNGDNSKMSALDYDPFSDE